MASTFVLQGPRWDGEQLGATGRVLDCLSVSREGRNAWEYEVEGGARKKALRTACQLCSPCVASESWFWFLCPLAPWGSVSCPLPLPSSVLSLVYPFPLGRGCPCWSLFLGFRSVIFCFFPCPLCLLWSQPLSVSSFWFWSLPLSGSPSCSPPPHLSLSSGVAS